MASAQHHRGEKQEGPGKIPFMSNHYPASYRRGQDGFVFVMDRAAVDRLKAMSDFEGREEPAVAEEILRSRVEGWAENLADAGADAGEVSIELDPHQRKAHLRRGSSLLFSADI
jgi:hypothetical protein